MSTNMPPVPYIIQMLDPTGKVSKSWDDFFRKLLVRVGGSTALSNTELANKFPVQAADIGAGQVGTSQLAGASVTTAKLGTITDGATLDQAGAGSTLEVKAAGIGTTQLANGAATFAKLLSSDWTASLAGSGYQKLGSGLYLQWGTTGSIASGTNTTQSFPVAFPTACFQVIAGISGNSAGLTSSTGQWGTGAYSTTGFTLYNRTNAAYTFNYLAVGN